MAEASDTPDTLSLSPDKVVKAREAINFLSSLPIPKLDGHLLLVRLQLELARLLATRIQVSDVLLTADIGTSL